MTNRYIVALLLIIFVLLSIIILVYLKFLLVKKFDRLLLQQNLPIPSSVNILPSSWNRANLYAIMIALNIYPKNSNSFRYKNYRKRYGTFHFKSHATKKEVICSKIYTILLILISLLLAYILIKGSIN